MKRLVIEAHRSTYPDPIRLEEGESFRLTGRTEIWDGHTWLWAVSQDGREGWVPDDLAAKCDDRIIAAYDYSAHELSVEPGQQVHAVKESHGWTWCEDGAGESGWVPSRILRDS